MPTKLRFVLRFIWICIVILASVSMSWPVQA